MSSAPAQSTQQPSQPCSTCRTGAATACTYPAAAGRASLQVAGARRTLACPAGPSSSSSYVTPQDAPSQTGPFVERGVRPQPQTNTCLVLCLLLLQPRRPQRCSIVRHNSTAETLCDWGPAWTCSQVRQACTRNWPSNQSYTHIGCTQHHQHALHLVTQQTWLICRCEVSLAELPDSPHNDRSTFIAAAHVRLCQQLGFCA